MPPELSQHLVRDQLDVSQLKIGDVFDGQDYLGSWHLAIVIDADGANKMIHFLPFTKANRNEPFSIDDDLHRVKPAYTMCEPPSDPGLQIQTLLTYLENNPPKMAKDSDLFAQHGRDNGSAAAH